MTVVAAICRPRRSLLLSLAGEAQLGMHSTLKGSDLTDLQSVESATGAEQAVSKVRQEKCRDGLSCWTDT